MAYVLAVLTAKTAEEAADAYGKLHPRFAADELVRRASGIRTGNPNWPSKPPHK
jgi:hypothetical protein